MSNPTPAATARPVARASFRWPAGPAVVSPTGPAGIGRYPHDTSRIDDETQGWILTLARRGWSCRRVAATVGVDWATAARCLDGWGVARNRRGMAQ